MQRRVLIIDDDRSMCELLEGAFGERQLEVTTRTSPLDALRLIVEQDFDVILTDLQMPDLTGVELCRRIAENRQDIPVVVMTAFGSIERAVEAIRAGAYDFITKPFDIEDLVLTIERALKHRALREEVRRLRGASEITQRFDDIIGASAAMKKVFDLIARLAESDASVLITGESGTGKELVARALHARSSRKEGPFVAINCAAMPEPLLESELFGHTKGAFTDARRERVGLFVRASNGTLFLDEIGEMPSGMQAKLLRALQERKVRPVGSDAEIPFDTRVFTATNRDLETEVHERRFREDLFYRVNVVRVHVPPLRTRGNDILLLAQHYITRDAAQSGRSVIGMTPGTAEKLLAYSWPGNVRELQNCIERAVALTRFDQISVEDLPERVRDVRSTRVLVDSTNAADLLSMEEVERRYVVRVLEAVGG